MTSPPRLDADQALSVFQLKDQKIHCYHFRPYIGAAVGGEFGQAH